jgi:diacylglycerol kinase (ATP)
MAQPDTAWSKNPSGIRRLAGAWRASVHGLRAVWQHESGFRQEVAACMGLVPLALWLPVSPLERLLLITVLLLVLIVEILNSAVEAAVDRIGLEHHELSGRAKDLGSAAVLLSLLIAALTWGTVLWTWWVR